MFQRRTFISKPYFKEEPYFLSVKNIQRTLLHYKSFFVNWKSSKDVKGSSWNQRCQITFIFKRVIVSMIPGRNFNIHEYFP